jgi:hypothetical protein
MVRIRKWMITELEIKIGDNTKIDLEIGSEDTR